MDTNISFLIYIVISLITVFSFFMTVNNNTKKSAENITSMQKQIENNATNIEKINRQIVSTDFLKEMKVDIDNLQEKMISRELFDDMRKRVDILSNQTEAILAMQTEIKTLFKSQENTNDKIDRIDNKIDSLVIALKK